MSDILMPKATAVWLVDNTSLSFEQIADFCGLHILEVQAIADDTASAASRSSLRPESLENSVAPMPAMTA